MSRGDRIIASTVLSAFPVGTAEGIAHCYQCRSIRPDRPRHWLSVGSPPVDADSTFSKQLTCGAAGHASSSLPPATLR